MARQALLEVAEKELPRHEMRLIRVVRTVGICHWALARRTSDDRLVELEIYDRALTSPLALTGYVNRTPIYSRKDTATCIRYPIDHINTDRMLIVVRPWHSGESLHQMLVRPGRLPAETAERIVASAGKTLRFVLKQSDTPVKELVTNLFICADGTVLMDATVHAPWTLASDADQLLSVFFEDGDSQEEAAKRFLMRFYLRLVTGRNAPSKADVDKLLSARMLSLSERQRVDEMLENPDELYWLDQRLTPGKSRIPWAPIVIAAAAIVVAVIAMRRHQELSQREWSGETGMPVAPALLLPAPAADVGRSEKGGSVSFVSYRLAEARREAKAGAFDAAFSLVDELAQQQNLNGDERLAIQRTKSDMQAAMAAAFTESMDRSRGLYEAGDEDGALRLLDTTITTFPKTTQTSEATDLASAIRAVQRERARRALNEDLAKRQEITRRNKEIQAVMELEYSLANRRYRSRLRLARERLANTPAVPLLQQLDQVAAAEEQLLHDFLATAAGPSREALAAACTPKWAGKRPVRISEIRAGGLVEFRPEGLGFVAWKSVTYSQFLQLFHDGRGIVAPDTHDYTLRLFLFCVRRQLPEAAKYRKMLAGTQHQQTAGAIANVWKNLEATAVVP